MILACFQVRCLGNIPHVTLLHPEICRNTCSHLKLCLKVLHLGVFRGWRSPLVNEGQRCPTVPRVGLCSTKQCPMGRKEGERNLWISITPVSPSPMVCLRPAKGGVALYKAKLLAFEVLKWNWFPTSSELGPPLLIWTALGGILMHFICFCTKWRFANTDANHGSWVIWPDCFRTKTPGEKNTSTFCWHFCKLFLLLFCWADFSFQPFL